MGHLAFSFTLKKSAEGKFESLDFTAETQLVPDPSMTFFLRDPSRLLTRTNRAVTLEDGMLSGLKTENEGQADKAIEAIASTWLNTINISAIQESLGAMTPVAAAAPLPNGARVFMQSGEDTQHKRAKILEHKLGTALAPLKEILLLVATIDDYHDSCLALRSGWQLSTRAEKEDLVARSVSDYRLIWTTPAEGCFQSDYGPFLELHATSSWPSVAVAAGPAPAKKCASQCSCPSPCENGTGLAGIYVRTPVPLYYTASLLVKPKELYLHRLTKLNAELALVRKHLEDHEDERSGVDAKKEELDRSQSEAMAKIAGWTAELEKDLDPKNRKAYADNIARAEKEIADATTKLEALAAFVAAYKEAERKRKELNNAAKVNLVLLYGLVTEVPDEKLTSIEDLVFRRSAVALLPSKDFVRIPLTDAAIGKTTHDLKLSRGVLSSASVDRPSSTVELLKVPLTVTNSAVASLTQLVQLRVNLANNQKAVAEAQLAVERVRQDLSLSVSESKKKEAALEAEIAEARARTKAAEARIAAVENQPPANSGTPSTEEQP